MIDTIIGVSGRADAPESPDSAVSWPAIIAGALVASAFSLALVSVGAGLGLVSVSPWSSNNPTIVTFGVIAGAWFIAVQLFASGVGGYLAGRLRVRWVGAHTDEVFFRDTAHGLLVWALGAVVSASLLAFAASSAAGGVARFGSAVGAAAGMAAGSAAQSSDRSAVGGDVQAGYFADALFRTDHPAGDAAASAAEAHRILSVDAVVGDVPAADKTYLAQLVAARTGMSQPDAEKRVSDVIDQAQGARRKAIDAAKTAADAARKTGVYVALWAFISLLVGAFSASYMATVGGRVRDDRSIAG